MSNSLTPDDVLHPHRWDLSDLQAPLKLGAPRLVEVPDLWADDVEMTEGQRHELLAIIALCPHLWFVLTTGNPERMAECLTTGDLGHRIYAQVQRWLDHEDGDPLGDGPLWDAAHEQAGKSATGSIIDFTAWTLPLPNLILSTHVETQAEANYRILHLLRCPAVVRGVDVVPREPIDLRHLLPSEFCRDCDCPESSHAMHDRTVGCQAGDGSEADPICGCRKLRGEATHRLGDPMANHGLRWLRVRGDSDPLHPDWVRSLRDQAVAAGVPFWFGGWGEWATIYDRDIDDPDWRRCGEVVTATPYPKGQWNNLAGGQGFHGDRVTYVHCVGPSASGRTLDCRVWDGVPGEVSRG